MHPEESITCPQYINPVEQREGVSVPLTAAGARPPPKLSTKQLKKSEASYHPEEGTACPQYISPPEQREGVSVPLTAAGTRPFQKLSTEELKKPETSHHLVQKQRRGLAQMDWHETHVSKGKC